MVGTKILMVDLSLDCRTCVSCAILEICCDPPYTKVKSLALFFSLLLNCLGLVGCVLIKKKNVSSPDLCSFLYPHFF